MQTKRLFFISFIVVVILLIPLVSMQFSDQVNWTLSDFVIGGLLLLFTGLIIDFVLRKTKNSKIRLPIIIGIIILFALLWAELAVGIFGTPWAGI